MAARAALMIFDDFVAAGTSGTVYVYTPDVLSDLLGAHDVIAFEVIADKVSLSGSGSLRVYLQHSADNRTFVYSSFGAAPPSAPDVSLPSLSPTAVNYGIGAYPGTYPLLGYVRFAVQFGESTTSGHVKLFVVQRDLA